LAAEATVTVLEHTMLKVLADTTFETKKLPLKVAPVLFAVRGVPAMSPCEFDVMTWTLRPGLPSATIEPTGTFNLPELKIPPRRATVYEVLIFDRLVRICPFAM
jgi:hypothetical protein